MKNFISYYRVSTDKQGESGLGLEAQKTDIENYIEGDKKRHQKPTCLLAEFTDVETGKYSTSNREGLNNAIILCRSIMSKGGDAILLIAKLDRLSRNVAFISALKDSGIKFICCDMPDANNFTIHIFAAVAEHEAEMISKRTRSALGAKKEQIKKDGGYVDKNGLFRTSLGNISNFSDAGRKKGAEVIRERSYDDRNNVMAYNHAIAIKAMKFKNEDGIEVFPTYEQIARKMNTDGFRTVTGSQFSATQIGRLFERYKKETV